MSYSIKVIEGEYNFNVNGGAVGVITFPVIMPSRKTVFLTRITTLTTLTSAGGTAECQLGVTGTPAFFQSAAVLANTFVANGVLTGTNGAFSTSSQAIILTITVEPVTAGRFIYQIFYLESTLLT